MILRNSNPVTLVVSVTLACCAVDMGVCNQVQPQQLSWCCDPSPLLNSGLLSCRNIVQFIGVGSTYPDATESARAGLFLVQEFMSGGTLKSLVMKHVMSNSHNPAYVYRHADSLRFAIQIASGLRYMHEASPMVRMLQPWPQNTTTSLFVVQSLVLVLFCLDACSFLRLVSRVTHASGN